MPGRGSEKRQKSGHLACRLPPQLDALVEQNRGWRSRSEWLRAVVIAAVGADADADTDIASPAKARRRRKAANGEIGRLLVPLGRGIGLSIQLSKYTRMSGQTELHEKSETLLRDLRKLKSELEIELLNDDRRLN
ncbi:MAG TPA: hypothetical protein P5307_07635 [Pirellulaceae bacterium]|nr:hypothetical protein [Pirellulaceae bacterium]